jgi:hypothetical protein
VKQSSTRVATVPEIHHASSPLMQGLGVFLLSGRHPADVDEAAVLLGRSGARVLRPHDGAAPGEVARWAARRTLDAAWLGRSERLAVPMESATDPRSALDALRADLQRMHGEALAAGIWTGIVAVLRADELAQMLVQCSSRGSGAVGDDLAHDAEAAPPCVRDAHSPAGGEVSLLGAASAIILIGFAALSRSRRELVRSVVDTLRADVVILEPARTGILGLFRRTGRPIVAADSSGLPGLDLGRGGLRCLRLRSAAGRLVDVVAYNDPRPFHPERLSAVLTQRVPSGEVGRVLRCDGLIRVASRPEQIGRWTMLGGVATLQASGLSAWSLGSPAGQELSFFGTGLNADALCRLLDSCLLSAAELAAGPALWMQFVDPLPL